MDSKFDLFRFSLLPRKQKDMERPSDPTREEYLRTLFSKKQQFTVRRTVYRYVPQPPEDGVKRSEIIGRIDRLIVVDEKSPPSTFPEDSQHETLQASVIAIDPTDHPDGQKASIEVGSKVGKTTSIMTNLVKALNEENQLSAFHIEVAPISDANAFWKFAEENSGEITRLAFTFFVPNMFGAKDNLEEELRSFGDKEGVQKVEISVSSSDGIKTDTEKIKESVAYAANGCGNIIAQSKGGKRYSSKDKTKRAIVKDTGGKLTPAKIAEHISGILGGE